MINSVCTAVRLLKSSDEKKKLQDEVKLACTILNDISDKFWHAPPQDIVAYISQNEGQFAQFQILKEKADEIQKHLQAFKVGNECIDDTRLWIELFAEDFRKAAKQLDLGP